MGDKQPIDAISDIARVVLPMFNDPRKVFTSFPFVVFEEPFPDDGCLVVVMRGLSVKGRHLYQLGARIEFGPDILIEPAAAEKVVFNRLAQAYIGIVQAAVRNAMVPVPMSLIEAYMKVGYKPAPRPDDLVVPPEKKLVIARA